jgi:hypothetical protein
MKSMQSSPERDSHCIIRLTKVISLSFQWPAVSHGVALDGLVFTPQRPLCRGIHALQEWFLVALSQGNAKKNKNKKSLDPLEF